MHLFPSTFISKIILFSGIIFYLGLFSSEENTTKKGIDFYNGNYEEALQKAKTEEKLVFVYLYADWCGVCKSLKKNTLKDKEVGQFYNDEYVSLALNAEKGEGKKIAKSIGLRSYPTLLFLDGGNGRILNQVSGYKSPIQLINLGKVYTE
tara:strand:- start:330 stop:779 length:450 start_codon:yes stop_codon:yes gene_type:complete